MTTNQTEFGIRSCSVCKKPKDELKARVSKLNPGTRLFLCAHCLSNKFEPRWLIVVTARTNGPSSVRDYLKNHRYVGDKITADEIIA